MGFFIGTLEVGSPPRARAGDLRFFLSCTLMEFKIPIEDVDASQDEPAPIGEETVEIQDTNVDNVTANEVTIERGGANIIQAEDVRITQGGCNIVKAKRVSMNQAAAGAIIAQKVEGKEITCGILLAREVKGDVRAVFTPMSAAGLAMGLVLALSLRRAFFGRE